MSTPSTPSTQITPTERGILTIACLSLFATIVTAAAGFVAYRHASLITRHIELIFTRDTILPLPFVTDTSPTTQPTSSTAQPKLPLGQLGKGFFSFTTDRGGVFLALRSPSRAARFPSYSPKAHKAIGTSLTNTDDLDRDATRHFYIIRKTLYLDCMGHARTPDSELWSHYNVDSFFPRVGRLVHENINLICGTAAVLTHNESGHGSNADFRGYCERPIESRIYGIRI